MSKAANGAGRAGRLASGLPALVLPLLGLPMLVLLAGCGHRDVVDTPQDWWHQLEGGAIARQRPPPPGVDDPYPKIGTTPAAAPQVASIELRRSTTADLVEQRNLSARLNAHDPLPPPVAVPAKGAKGGKAATPAASAAPATPNPAQSSATLDAAEAQPAPAAAPARSSGQSSSQSSGQSRSGQADAGQADSAPDLAMPEIAPPPPPPAGVVAGGPVVLPEIPAAPPPPPPGLPGIQMPPPPSYVVPARPDYTLSQAPGTPIQFLAGSDVLSPGQSGALQALATHRGAGVVFVHGYGDAASDLPQDQAQALTLAAYRARSVADALEKAGVPAASIRVRADAFGRGATAGLVD